MSFLYLIIIFVLISCNPCFYIRIYSILDVTQPGIYLLLVRILVGRFQSILVKRVTITGPGILWNLEIMLIIHVYIYMLYSNG